MKLCIVALIAWATALLGGGLCFAQDAEIFSTSVGERFYEIGYELSHAENATRRQLDQAWVFFQAVSEVDEGATYVLADQIKLATRYPAPDRSEQVSRMLLSYVNESADLEVAGQAVRYLLDKLQSREERERMLSELIATLEGRNDVLESELCTLLGLLMAEKADMNSASYLFSRAYNLDNYNSLAFEKLAEIAPDIIGSDVYLEQLRRMVAKNPLDLDAAMRFAAYAEQLELFEIAADSFEYCAELYEYIYPNQQLIDSIYLPWALSSYQVPQKRPQIQQIAAKAREKGVFDIILETVAAKSARKTGNVSLSDEIFDRIEEQSLERGYKDGFNACMELAWFYNFGKLEPESALEWANKAYSADPNSEPAAVMLAYTLAVNGQIEFARSVLEGLDSGQVALMTSGVVEKGAGNDLQASDLLKQAIAKRPDSLEAQRAREILTELGSQYVPQVAAEVVLEPLNNSFSNNLSPRFLPPDKMLSYQLNLKGSRFAYGSDLNAVVTITNNSYDPLVISDSGLLNGRIRIDCVVTGDIKRKIPSLVEKQVKPSQPIENGRSLVVPVRINTGELREILFRYPQARLDIRFTVYIDPTRGQAGRVVNKLSTIKPVPVLVERPAIKLDTDFLRNRLNALRQGRPGQKIQVARLFAGLLAEQKAMAQKPLYRYLSAPWMSEMIKSALIYNLRSDDWIVKVYTTAGLIDVPVGYELTGAMAENLGYHVWPVRLTTLYNLAGQGQRNFDQVLDHHAQFDQSPLVRQMAVALGGKAPENQDPSQTSPQTPDESPEQGAAGSLL